MSRSSDEQRIAALEEALLEYVGLYGLTDLAKKAFQVGAAAPTEGAARDKPEPPNIGKPDRSIE